MKRYKFATLASLMAIAATAQAQTCTVEAPELRFDNYSPLRSGATEGTTSLSISCVGGTDGQTVMYTISASTGSSNSYVSRSFVGEPLEYNLFTSLAPRIVWGDGTAGTQTIGDSFVLPNSSGPRIVYGEIPERQNVRPGIVSDTIHVQVTFQ